MEISGSSITGNSSRKGGGVNNILPTGYFSLSNSIVAGNTARVYGPDCSGNASSGGHNVIGNTNGCTVTTTSGDDFGSGLLTLDPQLAALAWNGEPSSTATATTGFSTYFQKTDSTAEA